MKSLFFFCSLMWFWFKLQWHHWPPEPELLRLVNWCIIFTDGYITNGHNIQRFPTWITNGLVKTIIHNITFPLAISCGFWTDFWMILASNCPGNIGSHRVLMEKNSAWFIHLYPLHAVVTFDESRHDCLFDDFPGCNFLRADFGHGQVTWLKCRCWISRCRTGVEGRVRLGGRFLC